MWLLRQNVQYNKRCFFKEIFIFVFVLHLILLGILFLCDTAKFHQERFVINTNNLQSTVVFMPLKKRVTEQHEVGNSGQKKDGAPKVISHNDYKKKLAADKVKKKKAVQAKKKALIPKPISKPIAKKILASAIKVEPKKNSPTMLQQEKNKKLEEDKAKALATKKAADLAKVQADKAKALAAKKKAALEKEKALLADKKKLAALSKATADKEKKAAEEKKLADKALEDKKKKVEEKIEPKIEKQPDIVVEEKITPKIEQAVIEQIISEIVHEQDDSQDVLAQALTQVEAELQDVSEDEEELDLDNISFIGSRDLEMMQIKQQIQAEIVKYYKPPVGIAKTAVCKLVFVVGSDRKAIRVTVKKSSGSMANDMCARAAVLKVPFPKEIIGKEITIELGQ
jgi:hypothetical protein